MAKALEAPIRQIAANAGLDGSVILEKVRTSGKTGYGFDAYKEEYCDMVSAGIIDPAKVTRSALENAASVSAMVLTTESLLADKPSPRSRLPPPAARWAACTKCKKHQAPWLSPGGFSRGDSACRRSTSIKH